MRLVSDPVSGRGLAACTCKLQALRAELDASTEVRLGIKSPRHGGFSREVRLTLDLGQVQDVAKLQIELGTLNTLPKVEIWLS